MTSIFNSFLKLLGLKKTDYARLVKEGAIIIDVRSTGEYDAGHIKGSVNIPLDQIGKKVFQFADKKKIIITCCASGMRSASAKNILKSKGFNQVYNGGGWNSLKNKI